MNIKQALFGERSTTKIAALFDNADSAMEAAQSTRQAAGMDAGQVVVLPPQRAQDMTSESLHRALVPENAGIWRTLVRSHVTLGLTGAVLGGVAYLIAASTGHPIIWSTPFMSLVAMVMFGLLFGLMVGGALTIRPDHGWLFSSVRQALSRGRWAVVVHPFNGLQASMALNRLGSRSTETMRTL